MKQEKDCSSKRTVMLVAIAFSLLVLVTVVFMNVLNSYELYRILDASVESQLISTSIAAREIIDVDAFDSYNSLEDVEADQVYYDQVLANLRSLADNVGADYIYALKEIDGEYLFIFDTDTEDEEIFIPYDISPVHEEAFTGLDAADTMNVDDEYGSFNTGAVPILKDGRIIGIISTDIQDAYLQKSINASVRNIVILVVLLVATMALMLFVVAKLYSRVRKMNRRLERMAHYDTVTGLPNRQYLLDYLAKKTSSPKKEPFALLFIDLDNFKKVNDNAGHDAGDELLQHIAKFLEGSQDHAMSFRPTAGILNIAARIGGDEFIQVVSGISTEEQAADLTQKLLADFESKAKDRYIEKFNVGLSIGVALYPYHSENYHVLIKYADIAMYNAKQGGKNGYRIYSDEMGAEKAN